MVGKGGEVRNSGRGDRPPSSDKDRVRRSCSAVDNSFVESSWILAPPPRMISRVESVGWKMLSAAPKTGGKMRYFVLVGAESAVVGGDGGVVRPRRRRCLGIIMRREDCLGGEGNWSSGRVMKRSFQNTGSPGFEDKKSFRGKGCS